MQQNDYKVVVEQNLKKLYIEETFVMVVMSSVSSYPFATEIQAFFSLPLNEKEYRKSWLPADTSIGDPIYLLLHYKTQEGDDVQKCAYYTDWNQYQLTCELEKIKKQGYRNRDKIDVVVKKALQEYPDFSTSEVSGKQYLLFEGSSKKRNYWGLIYKTTTNTIQSIYWTNAEKRRETLAIIDF